MTPIKYAIQKNLDPRIATMVVRSALIISTWYWVQNISFETPNPVVVKNVEQKVPDLNMAAIARISGG